MKTIAAFLALVLLPLASLHARIDLLLVPPERAVPPAAGLELTVYVNNPTDLPEEALLPLTVEADYASAQGPGRVTFTVIGGGAPLRVPAMHRVTVKLRLDQPIDAKSGFVSLRLTDPASNAIMFEVTGPSPTPAPPPVSTNQTPFMQPGAHVDLTSDVENMRRHISGYDPIYFAVGWRERFNARFQFSFKYRVFERSITQEPWWAVLGRDLYVAYTQTSIWDLESFSNPFSDTSYKPTLFLLHDFPRAPGNAWSFSLQGGAQHESNGKGGGATPAVPLTGLISAANALRHSTDTRSFNTLYVSPRARWTDDEGHFFEARGRLSAYFQEDENPDIAQYRGYAELTLRGGYDRGPQLSIHLRGRPDAHGSVEFNFTWPANQTPLLKRLEFLRTLGGYAQVQYFNGYGESLLDYDVRRRDQLRFGMMIVR